MSATAIADRWATAGSRGTVTAYELDERTVIEHRPCYRHASGVYAYAECSDRLRADVKTLLCGRGPGTHHYYHQTGDSRPIRSSVFCAAR